MTSERQTDSGIHVVEYGGTGPTPEKVEAPQELPERTWRCKQGHLFKNRFPFHLRFLIEGSPVLETEPLCPTCFRTWLENRFGVKEVVRSGQRAGEDVRVGSRASRRRGDGRD